MTETLVIEMTIGELILRLQHYKGVDNKIPVEIQMAINIVEEYSQYQAMEQRLKRVYGDCDGLLEKVVSHLEKHENTEFLEPVFKAKLLIDDEVDRWEAYKEIGTVEKIQEMKAELVRWHTDRLNDRIKNEFACMSTLVCHNCDHKDDYIEELEAEIEAYRAIGTVEECRESMEKQKAVCEPEYLWTNTVNGCVSGKCMCGNLVRSSYAFCNGCGVKLNWSNVYHGNRDVQY